MGYHAVCAQYARSAGSEYPVGCYTDYRCPVITISEGLLGFISRFGTRRDGGTPFASMQLCPQVCPGQSRSNEARPVTGWRPVLRVPRRC